MRLKVTLGVLPSCPHFRPKAAGDRNVRQLPDGTRPSHHDASAVPHVTAADVWEAIHDQFGLNIIADSYSRFYPAGEFTWKEAPLFDTLCRASDQLGARWKKEGDYVLCRSTSYFWDKVKEVPNRLLRQWRQASYGNEGLPLESLMEIAALSSQQLDSSHSGSVIEHCWDLPEWALVAAMGFREGVHYRERQPYVRLLSLLSPAAQRAALQPTGIGIEELLPVQQGELIQHLLRKGYRAQDLPGLRLRFEYAPAGAFIWVPDRESPRHAAAKQLPLVAGRTSEAAWTAARCLNPTATQSEIIRSRGMFVITLSEANGEVQTIGERE